MRGRRHRTAIRKMAYLHTYSRLAECASVHFQITFMAKRLFVIVQGIGGVGRSVDWDPLLESLKREPGLKDVSWYTYQRRPVPLGFTRLASFANDLAASINQEWVTNKGFDDVVLIGHSVGGLLVREAYVTNVEEAAWAKNVSRIVLLAAPNRGILRLPLYLRPLHWFLRLFLFWVRLTYQDLLYGSAFITNLRIKWIRCFRARAANPRPTIVQLLGTKDNFVYKYDSHDILAFPDSFYIEVPDATHRDLPELRTMGGTGDQMQLREESQGRYALLLSAITEDPVSRGQIKSAQPTPRPANFDRVVFVLHGIRASEIDDWVSEVAAEIQSQDAKAMVVRPSYGYLSALRFVLPSVRRRNLRWFQDQYTERLAQNPDAEFHFIGHSNGTYMLGQSLREIPGMQFKRVALAGSVLPADFFDGDSAINVQNQVASVRSDAGRFDWPVGILCRSLRQVLQMKDLGTGGYDGFSGGFVEEHRYYNGGHGGMFAKLDNIQSMVRFVLSGHSNPRPNTLDKSKRFDQLTRAAPYALTALLAAIVIGPWLLHHFLGTHPNAWYANLGLWYVGELLIVTAVAIVLDII